MLNEMETISTNVQPDVHKEIENYRKKYDISKSEAMRRLIQNGLEADDQEAIHDELQRMNSKISRLHEKVDRNKHKVEHSQEQITLGLRDIQREQRTGIWYNIRKIFKL